MLEVLEPPPAALDLLDDALQRTRPHQRRALVGDIDDTARRLQRMRHPRLTLTTHRTHGDETQASKGSA